MQSTRHENRTADPEDSGSLLIDIVDDEREIGELLAKTLASYRFRSRIFTSAFSALDGFEQERPALVVIDLGLPDMDGMELINRLRAAAPVAIIVLSGRSHTGDRIMGLELGADDYIVKPFDPREVVARIRSVLRRSGLLDTQIQTVSGTQKARFANWVFDPHSMRLISPSGQESDVSTGEAALLEILLRSPKRVLSRDYLLDHGGSDDSLDRSIDVRISRIRKKLSKESDKPLIRTVYGSGYMLTASVEWTE
ncbi:MAG: response regulator transcription factor [Stappiaceae bacterium]